MWAHVVVCSGRVVEQKRLLFELFGRSIDEELIRGISLIKEEVKTSSSSVWLDRKRGDAKGGKIVSPQIGVKTPFFPF